MKINIEFSSQIKRQANLSSLQVEVEPGCSIPDLIRKIADDYGDPLRQFVLNEAGCVHPTLLLVLDGKQIDANQPLELKDGDTLELLSPIAGG